jgi:Ran-binding protein 9/10
MRTNIRVRRFATKALNLSKLPGWDSGSWGYHGDDGLSFMGQPRTGATYGPRFGSMFFTHSREMGLTSQPANDTIGCGVNFLENNAFYTKNGKLLCMLQLPQLISAH